MEKITIGLYCNEYFVQKEVAISGKEDWHKHEDKSAHPYRTYYKNELKRLLFLMLCDLTEDILTDAGLERRIPAWETMTGVRPTKIPMNQLLQGKEKQEVEEQMRKWYCCTNEKLQLGLQIAIKEAALLKDISFEGGYSLYIGIPFCPTTCLYCSFPSYPYERFGYLADAYVKALKKEITAVSKECKNRKLTSIYMGGGTPTTLTAKQLEEVLTHIRQCFPTDDQYEFTVEAGRPDSITREKLAVLRKYHVERISVNPQTMQQKTLDLVGRNHTVAQTKDAFYLARKLGFDNINMDLIAGLPGEDAADMQDTLEKIEKLHPDSLTVHALAIKRAAKFGQEGRTMDPGSEITQMVEAAAASAERMGLVPYYLYRQKNIAGNFENVGYAEQDKAGVYNILIMEERQTIIACGAGSTTKLVLPEKIKTSSGKETNLIRVENVKNITEYIDRIDEMIERKEALFEKD